MRQKNVNTQMTISSGRTYICVYDRVTLVPVVEVRTFPHIQVRHCGVVSENEQIGEIPLNHLYYRMYVHDMVKESLTHLTYTIED